MKDFQDKAGKWIDKTFAPEIANSAPERALRFLEEALELFQAMDMERDQALALVDYVYAREKGLPTQEVGGVMTTLAALCSKCAASHDLDLERDARAEINRIDTPDVIESIRAKHAIKTAAGGISAVI
ncbi:MAG: hypothetical protein ACPGVT_12325 [Maricaulaceae bacterium]